MRGNSAEQRGFTLIELLIVVAIIAILAVIAIPRFSDAMLKAQVARVVGDFQALKSGLLRYKLDRGEFPDMYDVNKRGEHRSSVSLNVLTTPRQYLTNVNIVDPFAQKGAYEDIHRRIRKDVKVYLFFSYELTSLWMPQVGLHPTTHPEEFHSACSLVCWGPDLKQSLGEHLEISSGRSSPRSWGKMYDPTNGLRSDGDIVTAMGNIRFHHYRY